MSTTPFFPASFKQAGKKVCCTTTIDLITAAVNPDSLSDIQCPPFFLSSRFV